MACQVTQGICYCQQRQPTVINMYSSHQNGCLLEQVYNNYDERAILRVSVLGLEHLEYH